MANAPPAYLRERVRRRSALLLAGEVGHTAADILWSDRRRSAGLQARGAADEEPQADGDGERLQIGSDLRIKVRA